MLERFFIAPYVLRRLRSGALGHVVDDLAAHLHERLHSRRVARAYLCAAGHFSRWLAVERIRMRRIDEQTVARFLNEHLPNCECPGPSGSRCHVQSALIQTLSMLRERGYVPRPTSARTPVDAILGLFSSHLQTICGVTDLTRRHYLWRVRSFLERRYGSGPVTLENLRPAELIEFVSREAGRTSAISARSWSHALRSFVRFAHLHELCDGSIINAIPKIRCVRRLASLPKSLTEIQVEALLDSFDRSKAIGLRDYAIAVCLVDLGLRAGDVAALMLDDVDWQAGTLRLKVDKGRRARILPLPATVGRAVVAYLRGGRPRTKDRHIFVTHLLRGRPINTRVVTALISRAFQRADLTTPAKGAHCLRHTAATRMVRAGASLKEVADVLRHQSLETVMIYTKVDLPRLFEVALPWPEVRS